MIRYLDINNKERLKTIGKFSNGIREAYCKAKLNEITTRIRLGEDLPQLVRTKSQLTFDDLANRYFDDKLSTTNNSVKEKRRYTNHIKKYIGHFFPGNITADIILDMQKTYIEQFAPRTVNHLIFMITTIYKHALKKQIYKGSIPSSIIDNLKVDNKRERYLEVVEIEELLEEVKEISFDTWLFVKLCLSTGARVGSIMNIKKKDINFNTNKILIKDFKNNSTYNGFISDEILKDALREKIKNIKANDYILEGTRENITGKIRPILNHLFNQELELDDRKNRVVIHTLRHTFASHLAINGTPILTIKALMNHSSIEMTMRYAHLAPNSGLDEVRKLYQ